MTHLLDTNTCIYFLNRTSERIISQFKRFSPSGIKLPSITVAELLYGAEKSKAKKRIGRLLRILYQLLRLYPLMKRAVRYTQGSEPPLRNLVFQ